MGYINNYSDFLMDEALFLLKEEHFTWDYENNKKINHITGKVSPLVKSKLKESFNKSENKLEWFDKLLTKVTSLPEKSKKLIIYIGVILMLSNGISKKDILRTSEENSIELNILDIIPGIMNGSKSDSVKITKPKPVKGGFDDYKIAVAKRESSNKWKSINPLGYMGLYQIGYRALKDIGKKSKDPDLKDIHKKVSPSEFKENPNIFPINIQDKCFKELVKLNKHYLRNYKHYIGKTIEYKDLETGEIKSIKITESGMLGGAHLVGNGGVKKFLKSNGEEIPTDANGTPVTEYLKLFANYKLDLD